MILQWGLPVLLFLCGGYYTISSRFFCIRNIGKAFRSVLKKQNDDAGISVFSSMCTSLGATVGVGNIVGVAAAVTQGGPGALFWMMFSAFFGMSVKFAENALGALFQIKIKKDDFFGGPFSYIDGGLGKRYHALAVIYAFAVILEGVLGMGTIIQSGSVVASAELLIDRSGGLWRIVLSFCLTALTAVVILGGAKRIAKVSEFIVPLMSVVYFLACAVILMRFRNEIPRVITEIITEAWSVKASAGAVSGLILKKGILLGVQRGVFSNEAGLGTSAISAAAAKGNDPVVHGYTGIISVFLDTVVLCTLTGLTVLVTGSNSGSGLRTAAECWNVGLFQNAEYILSVFMVVFGFTSILGWNFFVERCSLYLFHDPRMTKLVQFLFLAAVFLGPFLSEDMSWKMADFLNVFLAVPNLIALVLLRKKALTVMQ